MPSPEEHRALPFAHHLVAPALEESVANSLLDIFDSVDWTRRGCSFYRLDVPALLEDKHTIREVLGQSTQVIGRRQLFEEAYGLRLSPKPGLEIHRYSEGCGIGPHTDAEPPELRHVICLNRGWHLERGGVWILASDSKLFEGKSYLPSLSNTGFAFPTSPRSFHALSTYRGVPIYCVTLRYQIERRQAEWTEFNLTDGEWRIPGAKMKMRRPHRVGIPRGR